MTGGSETDSCRYESDQAGSVAEDESAVDNNGVCEESTQLSVVDNVPRTR